MGQHLVLAGGGHAHMVTLANLNAFIEKGHQVTVIGPSDYHYYSGMGPGMLGKFYTPDDIRFATRHMVEKQGADFVLGKITHIDPKEKKIFIGERKPVTYDVLSFNVGSYVPNAFITEDNGDIYSVKPIERLLEAQKRIEQLVSEKEAVIDVIGGGPAATEVAGNIWRLAHHTQKFTPKIRVFADKKFMAHFPESIRKRTVKSLLKRGVDIAENSRVRKVKTGSIELDSGKIFQTDLIFLAIGVKPSPVFETSGLPTGPDGGLLVNTFLQSTEYPEIFGGGDCIYFQDQPLDKVGVYAVRQNHVLYHNLMASLDGSNLQPFEPGGDYLLIFNLGDGTGILKKKWFTISGKTAFLIKDYIDRTFMKKFQAYEK